MTLPDVAVTLPDYAVDRRASIPTIAACASG